MKKEEHKILFGGEEFISLQEAANCFAIEFKYLMAMAKKGKLKVFKSENNWYTCEKWILDHKAKILHLLHKEIKEQEKNLKHLGKWVKEVF